MDARVAVNVRLLAGSPRARAGRLTWDRIGPWLLLSPTVVSVVAFVYGFIATTFYTSLSHWSSLRPNLAYKGFSVYLDLFSNLRFQIDLRNIVIFTALFLALATFVGLVLALLLDQGVRGASFFRNLFLFPMAVSFVVAGVAWQWVFNPAAGINQLIARSGFDTLLRWVGLDPMNFQWIADPRILGSITPWLRQHVPGLENLRLQLGLPVAIIPVVFAASWQLSGFAMAMYLAGLSTIPSELREAAAIDGASRVQTYRYIILPALRPFTVSTLIVLTYMSLKSFDLVYAMTGSGPGFATDVPGIFVFETTFKALRYNLGAAAAMVMLAMVAVVVVPYLVRQSREGRA